MSRLVVAVVLLLTTRASAESTCDEAGLCCDEWIIDVRRDNGTVWGAVTAKTLEATREKLEQARDFDRQSCAWAHKSYPCSQLHYERPAKPRCYGTTRPHQEDEACTEKVARRVESLVARFQTQTLRYSATVETYETLRRGVEKLVPLRNPFAQLRWGFSSFGGVLNDGADRAKKLLSLLEQECMPPETTSAADRLFAAGPQGERSMSRRRVLMSELEELERVSAREPNAPVFATLDVPAEYPSATVKRVKLSNSGRIVLGENGPASEGPLTPGVHIPVVFVRPLPDGSGADLLPVRIERRSQRDEEVFVLRGGPAANEELLEVHLGARDRDRDGFSDAVDKCPDKAGPNSGCPLDSDGDGVADGEDRCPSMTGRADLAGCPSEERPSRSASPPIYLCAGSSCEPGVVPPPTPAGAPRIASCDEFTAANGLVPIDTCAADYPGRNAGCDVFDGTSGAQVPNALYCFHTPWRTPDGRYRDDLHRTHWACCVSH